MNLMYARITFLVTTVYWRTWYVVGLHLSYYEGLFKLERESHAEFYISLLVSSEPCTQISLQPL